MPRPVNDSNETVIVSYSLMFDPTGIITSPNNVLAPCRYCSLKPLETDDIFLIVTVTEPNSVASIPKF